jgi:hypothetical protein
MCLSFPGHWVFGYIPVWLSNPYFFYPFLRLGFAILDILGVVYWILSSISRNTVNPLRGVPEMGRTAEV